MSQKFKTFQEKFVDLFDLNKGTLHHANQNNAWLTLVYCIQRTQIRQNRHDITYILSKLFSDEKRNIEYNLGEDQRKTR